MSEDLQTKANKTFTLSTLTAMLFLSWRDVDRNWNISRFFKKAPAAQPLEQPVQQPFETAPAE